MPEPADRPQSDSRNLSVGDICRSTIYDDPELLAQCMFVWFHSDPDAAVLASQWVERLADALAEMGRGN